MTDRVLKRSARLQWLTSPPSGAGRLAVASGAFSVVKISLALEDPIPGQTTPSELFACTVAGYLGMHLSLRMRENQSPLRELTVDANLTISPWPEYVTQSIEFDVIARLDGHEALDESAFRDHAEQTLATVAKSLCLSDRLLHLAGARLQ